MRPSFEKYDFVGHVFFPYCEETVNMFFRSRNASIYEVYSNGKLISKNVPVSSIVAPILSDTGLVLKRTNKITISGKESINKIQVRVHKVVSTSGEPEIHVSVKARTVQELTDNTKNLIEYVKETTGITGKADLFGKMDLC